MLSKIEADGSIENSPVYFSSTTKTAINSEFSLNKSFKEILYRIDNWINQGSGWIVVEIEGFYLNVSSYSPLVVSTYTELPNELKHARKGLINIQNDDNKCFLWFHIRYLNLIDKNPQKITKKIKNLLINLIMKGLIFLFQRKIIAKLKCKIKFVLMCFVMKIKKFILFIYQIINLMIVWICC